MENLVIDPSQFISIMPAFITKFTSYLKPFLPDDSKFVVFLPYILWVLSMVWLHYVFGDQWLALYAVNWLLIAMSASEAYNEGKKSADKKNDIDVQSEDNSRSLDLIW